MGFFADIIINFHIYFESCWAFWGVVFLFEGTGAQVTGLSAVAMQENDSDVIEVRYSKDSNLEVLLNQKVVSFSEQSWLDLKG